MKWPGVADQRIIQRYPAARPTCPVASSVRPS